MLLTTASLIFGALVSPSVATDSLHYLVGINTSTDDVPGSSGYWVKKGSTGALVRSTSDGNADDDIQWAVDQNSNVLLTAGSFVFSNSITLRSELQIKGQGKSGSILSLAANIIPLNLANLHDVEISDLLIVAHTAQTQPLIRISASTGIAARNNFRGIQLSGGAADRFTAIQLYASGSGGIWNCLFDDISASGIGTVVELNTQASAGWISGNRFENFFVDDYVIGIDLTSGGGLGSNGNRFSSWGAQSGARSTFGLRIANSTAGTNRNNMFYACDFHDLSAYNSNGKYFSIGTGVTGSVLIAFSSQEISAPFFTDNGSNTLAVNAEDHLAKLIGKGNSLHLPTEQGWTQALTGSGSASQQVSYNLVRTGTTLGSSSRLYTSAPIFGLQSSNFSQVDFSKRLIFIFNYARSAGATSATARVQMKTSTAEGALSGEGLGIRVANFALYGESFGTAHQEVNLSTTLAADQAVQIKIILYPGSRIEWWVDGILKATQTAAVYLPTGGAVSSLVHSITTSGQTIDAQSYLMQPKLWQAR